MPPAMTREERDDALLEGVAGAVNIYMNRDGLPFKQAFDKALAAKEARRQFWLREIIDPLARKHGTTREVILSVLYCDDGPEQPCLSDAAWAEGSAFAAATLLEAGLRRIPLGIQRSLPV